MTGARNHHGTETIMGVGCQLTIPAPARIRDVADVIAGLLGFPVYKIPLGNDGYAARVDGIQFLSYDNMPECSRIITPMPIGPWDVYETLYHYEWDELGNHGIMPRSRPINIALCIALCDFFGGRIDFNDCDDSDCDYRQPAREDIHATNGQPWNAFQDRILAVRPLTKEDIERYRDVAAYTE